MSVQSPNMNLTLWNSPNDNFNYTQLQQNFTLVDSHNHTPGQGVQIPTGGIVNQAVTAAQIANNTITANQIAAGAIGTTQIATGAVGSNQLAVGAVGFAQIATDTIRTSNFLPGVSSMTITTQTSSYNANYGDFILANGSFTITLPAPVANRSIAVMNVGTGALTIATNAGQQIIGRGLNATSFPLSSMGVEVFLVSDGINWYIEAGVQDSGYISQEVHFNELP